MWTYVRYRLQMLCGLTVSRKNLVFLHGVDVSQATVYFTMLIEAIFNIVIDGSKSNCQIEDGVVL